MFFNNFCGIFDLVRGPHRPSIWSAPHADQTGQPPKKLGLNPVLDVVAHGHPSCNGVTAPRDEAKAASDQLC